MQSCFQFPAKDWQSLLGLVVRVAPLSLFCFQTINMSIQSLCYLKASRNRWFGQPGGDLGLHEMSWHSCSLGSTPAMHLSHVVRLRYSEVIVVQFQAALHPVIPFEKPKLLFTFPLELNVALQLKNSGDWMVLSNTVPCGKLPSDLPLTQPTSE